MAQLIGSGTTLQSIESHSNDSTIQTAYASRIVQSKGTISINLSRSDAFLAGRTEILLLSDSTSEKRDSRQCKAHQSNTLPYSDDVGFDRSVKIVRVHGK